MGRFERILRGAGSLLVVALLAALLSLGLRTLLEAAGIPAARAGPVGITTAIALALAVADVWTPIGRGPSHGDISEKEAGALAADLLVTGILTLAASVALVLLGEAVWAPLGSLVAVFVVGVGVGYGAFMLRNREYYFEERPAGVGE